MQKQTCVKLKLDCLFLETIRLVRHGRIYCLGQRMFVVGKQLHEAAQYLEIVQNVGWINMFAIGMLKNPFYNS